MQVLSYRKQSVTVYFSGPTLSTLSDIGPFFFGGQGQFFWWARSWKVIDLVGKVTGL